MSIAYNLDNLGHCIGSGADRSVFELLGTNLVVKKSSNSQETFQSVVEKHIWEKMTPKEKTIMPIVDILVHHGIIHFVMKKCRSMEQLSSTFWDKDEQEILDHLGVSEENIDYVHDVLDRYDVCDTHDENFGVDEDGNYYLLDAGFNHFRDDILAKEGREGLDSNNRSSDYCVECGEYGDDCCCDCEWDDYLAKREIE